MSTVNGTTNGAHVNGDHAAPISDEPTETLIIDNFDSFTWNLYQYLSILNANVRVIRNDAITPADFPNLRIKNLIISPGPGHPKTDSGISNQIIDYFAGKVPVLGVCMGLECIVDLYGGEIAYAGEIKHGKTSKVRHDNRGCFKDVPQSLPSTRYHSLSANITSLPDVLTVTSTTEESGVIMGVRHRKYTVEGVQYHPESIMSDGGQALLKNFLELKGGTWEENPSFGVLDSSLPPFSGTAPTPSPKPPTILEKIHVQRRKDIELAKSTPGTTPSDLKTLLSLHLSPPQIPLVARLKAGVAEGKGDAALMAEIKRASPSKGPIAMSANAAQQALTYALAGASVISVLTEPSWFKGSLLDMRLARQAIDTLPSRPAILRKDFIIDEYQIDEARLHGADTVLLIVAMLSPTRLKELYTYSLSLNMEPLVEVNNQAEMSIALDLGAKVIGVNNRNLHDFEVDMNNTSRLAGMVKERGIILCALSGISKREDVKKYVDQGVGAVLVGEALMRATDTSKFIRTLLDIPPPLPTQKSVTAPLVKVCGIRSKEMAILAAEAGADLIGVMLVPDSKRVVSLETASAISSAIRSYRSQHPHQSSPAPTPKSWFASHAHQLSTISSRPLVVGVFQNQPLSFILEAVSTAQLDLVQFHGDEPPNWALHIPVPVIRAFHVREHGTGLEDLGRSGLYKHILLDAVVPGAQLSGGTGTKLDWDLAVSAVEKQSVGDEKLPIILAGGLTPENIGEAVGKVRPWAVDVSGGVESGGVKDGEKVRAFIKAAKGVKV
jgi:anthranilate synthase/indole-3-glycerol phosphate synthase/phosphoribosylanthranilate isomerase